MTESEWLKCDDPAPLLEAVRERWYDAREFSAMPILADALQDAGCDDEAMLNYCRSDEGRRPITFAYLACVGLFRRCA
jgi:hypothetical protein